MTRPLLNHSERRTYAALTAALADTGMSVHAQMRCIDALRGHIDERDLKSPSRELGLLDGSEYGYALRAHFDFVVLDHDLEPVLAVEFDGPSHTDPVQVARDCRKNRLCFIAGLPLLRVHDAHLQRAEQVVILEWFVRLWQAYKQQMPLLVAERDEQVDSLADEDVSPFLLADRPDLDVEFVFRLSNPFPPTLTWAAELHRRHRIHVMGSDYRYRCDQKCVADGTTVQGEPFPDLGTDDTIAYTCILRVGDKTVATGRYETTGLYPWYPPDEQGRNPLAGLLSGTPAGPWLGAGTHVAYGMSFRNALRDLDEWARHR
jgi:hypothetical protein